MKFDIATQKLVCEYCANSEDPYAHPDGTQAKEDDSFDVTVFTCPQCGGEIYSMSTEATQYCTYCGSQVMLEGRLVNQNRPHRIIPFQKTKEDCKKIYQEVTKKALFAPRELKDPEFIDKFRGIYLPYWVYDYAQNGTVRLKGTRERGNKTEYCDLSVDVDNTFSGITFDASSSFDDTLAAQIAPFKAQNMMDFTPAYLCGFYADTADVPEEVYEMAAETLVNEEAMDRIRAKFGDIHVDSIPDKTGSFHTVKTGQTAALLPVWFLTWRSGDRVAYAVVNGETGKMAADIPVDPKRYLTGSLLLALPIFLLLLFMPVMTGGTVLTASMVLGIFSAVMFSRSLYKMTRHEQRSDDLGYQATVGKNLDQNKKAAEAKKKVYGAGIRLELFLVAAAIAFGGWIMLTSPVSDAWYYAGSTVIMAMICLLALKMINRYNLLATRPIPDFHDRKGAE